VHSYIFLAGIIYCIVKLKRNRDRNESNDHPLETVRVDGDPEKEQEHLLKEDRVRVVANVS